MLPLSRTPVSKLTARSEATRIAVSLRTQTGFYHYHSSNFPYHYNFGWPMELFLSPNDPQRTIFVSSNGVAHYRVRTFKRGGFAGAGRRYSTTIQRNADSEEEALVAEIEWKTLGTSTIVRSVLLEEVVVKAKNFLYKRNQFSR